MTACPAAASEWDPAARHQGCWWRELWWKQECLLRLTQGYGGGRSGGGSWSRDEHVALILQAQLHR